MKTNRSERYLTPKEKVLLGMLAASMATLPSAILNHNPIYKWLAAVSIPLPILVALVVLIINRLKTPAP